MTHSPILIAGCGFSLVTGLLVGGLLRAGRRPVVIPVKSPQEQVSAMVGQMAAKRSNLATAGNDDDDALARVVAKETIIQEILSDPELRNAARGPHVKAELTSVVQRSEKLRAIQDELAHDPAAIRAMAREIVVRQALDDDTIAEMAQQALLSPHTRPSAPNHH